MAKTRLNIPALVDNLILPHSAVDGDHLGLPYRSVSLQTLNTKEKSSRPQESPLKQLTRPNSYPPQTQEGSNLAA
ncbi:hypothetical protein NPIL_527511 [Nephila pilipes]|uniref:Uncharacterized protein n=1 Tax=Nephila pilipes TaxID=299642 RepID=A0A8X6INE4_NEPPI|nr:hypothetical protein NPIL_527511 [Nephila pilipes]